MRTTEGSGGKVLTCSPIPATVTSVNLALLAGSESRTCRTLGVTLSVVGVDRAIGAEGQTPRRIRVVVFAFGENLCSIGTHRGGRVPGTWGSPIDQTGCLVRVSPAGLCTHSTWLVDKSHHHHRQEQQQRRDTRHVDTTDGASSADE